MDNCCSVPYKKGKGINLLSFCHEEAELEVHRLKPKIEPSPETAISSGREALCQLVIFGDTKLLQW